MNNFSRESLEMIIFTLLLFLFLTLTLLFFAYYDKGGKHEISAQNYRGASKCDYAI